MFKIERLKNIDWLIVSAVVALNIIGIVTIWSATGIRDGGLNAFLNSYPVKQTIYMCMGIGVMLFLACFNYLYFQRYAWWIYGFVIILLLYVLFFGTAFRGARRWIPLGPINLQPSELAKVSVTLALARYLMYEKHLERLPNLIPPFLIAIIPTLLIVLEPDLGTALLFGPLFLTILFTAGASPKHIGTAILATLLLAPIMYRYALEDYQKERIIGFIQPEKVPFREGYHLIRSRIAIGSGGLSGKGFGHPGEDYSRLVPERHNDFIFTVIGEEGGFAGAASVVVFFLLLVFSLLKTAFFTREPFGRLVLTGFATLFTVQPFINIGMTIGLAPVTGLTLPFVSYGGSSLMASYFIIGIALAIKTRSVPSFSSRDHDYQNETIRETPTQYEGTIE